MKRTKFIVIQDGFSRKIWLKDDMRIIRYENYTTYYPYIIQEFSDARWKDIKSFHTLKEAKDYINTYKL